MKPVISGCGMLKPIKATKSETSPHVKLLPYSFHGRETAVSPALKIATNQYKIIQISNFYQILDTNDSDAFAMAGLLGHGRHAASEHTALAALSLRVCWVAPNEVLDLEECHGHESPESGTRKDTFPTVSTSPVRGGSKKMIVRKRKNKLTSLLRKLDTTLPSNLNSF